MESPKIYVADLGAYNEGFLLGEWLDLSDYSDADDLMEKITELTDKWAEDRGVEETEWAVHDYEYIPSNLASEYMGKNSFEKIYEMMEVVENTGLPLDVVEEWMSHTGSDSPESIEDAYYGTYKDASDFAYELVEDGVYIPSSYEVYVSDTDARIIAGEEEDRYREDAEYEGELSEEEIDERADEIYDEWYNGLKDDPIYFLTEEMGMYSEEDAIKASFVGIDYDKIAENLSVDYLYIDYDGETYVFSPNYRKGGTVGRKSSIPKGSTQLFEGEKVYITNSSPSSVEFSYLREDGKPYSKKFRVPRKQFEKNKFEKGGTTYSNDIIDPIIKKAETLEKSNDSSYSSKEEAKRVKRFGKSIKEDLKSLKDRVEDSVKDGKKSVRRLEDETYFEKGGTTYSGGGKITPEQRQAVKLISRAYRDLGGSKLRIAHTTIYKSGLENISALIRDGRDMEAEQLAEEVAYKLWEHEDKFEKGGTTMSSDEIKSLEAVINSDLIPESLKKQAREKLAKIKGKKSTEKPATKPAEKADKVAKKPSSRKGQSPPPHLKLAKIIRKEGETWQDAMRRAGAMLKKDEKALEKAIAGAPKKTIKRTKATTKKEEPKKTIRRTKATTKKAEPKKRIKRTKATSKKVGSSTGTVKKGKIRRTYPRQGEASESRDKARKALHAGKRVSESGNVYYETRANRADEDRRKKL